MSRSSMPTVSDEGGFAAWAELRLSKPFLMALSELNFNTPTPIQKEAIPVGLQGRDVLGTAETGSGKTAAFLLPILERLWHAPSVHCRKRTSSGLTGGRAATRVLILLPTRELAIQCNDMIESFAKYTPITHSLVYGGMSMQANASALRHQPDIVVATPGRVLDLLMNSQSVHMEMLEIVVLDEADRLLEMGFKEECLQVLRHCSRTKQTLLFSATLNDEISDLAELALSRPVRVATNSASKVAKTLSQEFVQIPDESSREATLLHLCKTAYTKNTIIFFQTKSTAHRVSIIFKIMGIEHSELHGNLAQSARQAGLERFQAGEAHFLLATELASRGLDIAHVSTVINFHPPQDIVRYVHRVGRTARMGASGKAVTLFTEDERLQVKRIVRRVSQNNSAQKGAKETFQSRRMQNQTVAKWAKAIEAMEAQIKKTLKTEYAEKEAKLAEIYVRKTENLRLFEDEIMRRPEKKWYMTHKEKVAAKESSRQEAEERAKEIKSEKVSLSREENKRELKRAKAATKAQQERRKETMSTKILGRRAKREAKQPRLRVTHDSVEAEKNHIKSSGSGKPKNRKKMSVPRQSHADSPVSKRKTDKKVKKVKKNRGAFKSKNRYKRR